MSEACDVPKMGVPTTDVGMTILGASVTQLLAYS